MMDTNLDITELAFEASLDELEKTVARLEAGELSLEEALTYFERGQLLANHCSRLLDEATLRVEQLTEDGEIKALEID